MTTTTIQPTDITALRKLSGKRRSITYTLFCAILLIIMTASVMVGSVPISLDELVSILVTHDTAGVNGFIIWKIRLPRAIAAALGGGYLAVAGLLLQVFFRNPIVGPFILGISSGATLMVSFVMLTSLTLGFTVLNPFMATLAAFTGAYGVMVIVVAIAGRVKNAVTLLIVGLMMGYLCHAVTSVLVAFAEKEKIKGFVLWQLGSFSGFRWSEIEIMIIAGGLICLLVYALAKPLNAFLLGEEYAASMGVNIKLFRLLILLSSCALAGMITSVAGPVAFVGLAVPHMVRLAFGTSDNRILIPGSLLVGAVVTCLCDFIARMVFSPVELPISAITAFFGAPIVIGLLLKRKVVL
ncbi:FecCD family ABC transporter permease [Desulfobacula toluolica]|uniref:ABC transporter, permease protein n=1 Tax=Desulfobacula toluolica (strain DSM 7467 / Tol2) TaxID=651182 RepID=K0NCS0_DESTT|nr:iron ABC transporter permease [Desulfobacula toluolica]CCK82354.1 ABC transporter, permease protein [Desulfobacula toluolica Tol2]